MNHTCESQAARQSLLCKLFSEGSGFVYFWNIHRNLFHRKQSFLAGSSFFKSPWPRSFSHPQPLSLFSSWRITVIRRGKGSPARASANTGSWRTGRTWRREMGHSTRLKRNSIVPEQCGPFHWNGRCLDTRETEVLHCSSLRSSPATNNAAWKHWKERFPEMDSK